MYSSFSNPSDPVFLSTNHATQVVLGDDFVYETLTVDGLKLKYKQLEGGVHAAERVYFGQDVGMGEKRVFV